MTFCIQDESKQSAPASKPGSAKSKPGSAKSKPGSAKSGAGSARTGSAKSKAKSATRSPSPKGKKTPKSKCIFFLSLVQLTHCGLVMSHDDIDLGQHWLR